ncbi:MAG: hypothetical protein K6T73_10580 [Candidatus Bathyarchaeota archaeon]|nr:hypothetical protein [Candidatus Bathyarchaeota archaeon]
MEKELTLFGKDASNLIGGSGEIIAWDVLRKMGIWTYKIGTWNFFPKGYPHFRDRELTFLTKTQAEFVEKKEENGITEFDFVGIKGEVGEVYLVEVKTGRGANIRHYAKNPIRAFSPENLEKAKAIGFKIALVVVELLENWKCRISYREL